MSVHVLSDDLSAPVDDGARDHVEGQRVPALTLESSQKLVSLRELGADLGVLHAPDRDNAEVVAWLSAQRSA